MQQGRTQDDGFIKYVHDGPPYRLFVDRGRSFQTRTGRGIKPKGNTYNFDVIEGSDSLGMLTISSNYETAYTNLIKFVNSLDRSPRFVPIDSLQATPQQSGGTLNVTVKMYAFVREESAAP